jgi:hypothetical protein
MNSPYFPFPHSPGLLQGAADLSFPQLTPQITLADGSVLMPLAWFTNVKVTRRGATTEVSWRQPALDRMGGKEPVRDARAEIQTRYLFTPGRIRREDRLLVKSGSRVRSIAVELASFSAQPRTASAATSFGSGVIRSFRTGGYGSCSGAANRDLKLAAPTGQFRSLVRCERRLGGPANGALALSWELTYR